MAKYQKAIPPKTASNLTVLGARFDEQGNPTEVKWFTDKGFTLIPDDLNFTKGGGRVRVKNGGWKRVSPEDFEPAPAPLTAAQVTGQPANVPDPNKVVVTEGVDLNAKKDDDGDKDQSGDAGKVGDQDQKAPEAKETAKADPKAGSKKQ